MKQASGIWLPDGDVHFEGMLAASPMLAGAGTYQYRKYLAARGHAAGRGLAVDVGAHVGLWTRIMALDFARVVAFEPMAEHAACFRRNVTAPHVVLHELALGAVDGAVGMISTRDNSGNARIDKAGSGVAMRTLDAMSLRGIDLLKIDVEGFEVDVIAGGEVTIRRDRPVLVVEQKPGNAERFGRGQWDAVAMLKSWGAREATVISGDHVMVW